MTGQQRAAIETATVEFLSKVLSCHSHNQVVFAQVLCDVIKNQGHLHQGQFIYRQSLEEYETTV